jgi:hypothetical protein
VKDETEEGGNQAGSSADSYSYGVDFDKNGQATMDDYQADVNKR